MKEQKLLEFKGELEAIATYGNETITEREFKEFFKDFRDYTTKHGIETPEIFKYSGSMIDFRRKMQTYGGYAERRQVLDDTIYNYVLKCFFLIDLKLDKQTHQDIGQMDFYVRYYDNEIKAEEDNPTINTMFKQKIYNSKIFYS